MIEHKKRFFYFYMKYNRFLRIEFKFLNYLTASLSEFEFMGLP